MAGAVNTGNEDGAHHVIGEIAGALGCTIPGRPLPAGIITAQRRPGSAPTRLPDAAS
jgi:hypothetical protein